jgi:dihydrofolate synthase / folylpolyglutamate synthase
MTYKETLSYLYSRLPMYQRVGGAAYKADLSNTNKLIEILDHPERDLKCIHIAGTNGKGSVSNILASVLIDAGYKTGLYTSPHLFDFRERITINGKKISEMEVIDFVSKYKQAFEDINLSFFEWTVGLAFYFFKKQQTDVAVIETGLGGRLDSTNVITPMLSVITNVSMDHMNLLGDTIEKIAAEKAGIIKPGIPVVIGEHDTDTDNVLIKKCNENNSPYYFAADAYHTTDEKYIDDGNMQFDIYKKDELFLNNLQTDLAGDYQKKNICTALTALELLNKNNICVSKETIEKGLQHVRHKMKFDGRWQIINTSPFVVCDSAHNSAGINVVMQQIKKIHHKNLHFILGMSGDKDLSGILQLFPADAQYYFCKANVPRAIDAGALKKIALSHNLKGTEYSNVASAIVAAYKELQENDLLYIGGSTFTVSDALLFFKNNRQEI